MILFQTRSPKGDHVAFLFGDAVTATLEEAARQAHPTGPDRAVYPRVRVLLQRLLCL